MVYINLIIGLVFGLVFFLCAIKAYTLGLQHGKQISNGTVPEVKINPVQAYKEVKTSFQNGKQAVTLTEELSDIMGVTKESMLDEIQKRK
jgi:hypothetical protein